MEDPPARTEALAGDSLEKPTFLLPGGGCGEPGEKVPLRHQGSIRDDTTCLEFLHSILALFLGSQGEVYGWEALLSFPQSCAC